MNRAWEVGLKQKRPRNKGQQHKRDTDTGAGYWSDYALWSSRPAPRKAASPSDMRLLVATQRHVG